MTTPRDDVLRQSAARERVQELAHAHGFDGDAERFDDAGLLQQRAVLCRRCRRRVLRPKKRLVRPRLDTPWPGWVCWPTVWVNRPHPRVRAWPHVRARGESLGR